VPVPLRLRRPRVHRSWTHAWWEGDEAWSARLGPAPGTTALDAVAAGLERRRFDPSWTRALRGRTAARVPGDALAVVAGQQPVLAGGAALVVHKAASAIVLARRLAERWGRVVVPVFWIATQDHDGSEIDHVDLTDPARRTLRRVAARVRPGHDAFWRSTWDPTSWRAAVDELATLAELREPWLAALDAQREDAPVDAHVAALLDELFGAHGLVTVAAHEVEPLARDVLDAVLREPAPAHASLAEGARALAALGETAPFDPDDPRPLVLESREGRRQRLEAGDEDARARLSRHPDDFSPHAALRPVLQARALPVVAQVVGPSELLYLGQARGLHEVFDAPPPVLVPRLEATRVEPGELASLREDPERAQSWLDGPETEGELVEAEQRLLAAARAFGERVLAVEPSLAGRARRFLGTVRKGARRLAAAPAWRRSGLGRRRDTLRPRGRPQDAVLAWLPDAARAPSPACYADHLLALADPLAPPAHVLHALPGPPSPDPQEARDG